MMQGWRCGEAEGTSAPPDSDVIEPGHSPGIRIFESSPGDSNVKPQRQPVTDNKH